SCDLPSLSHAEERGHRFFASLYSAWVKGADLRVRKTLPARRRRHARRKATNVGGRRLPAAPFREFYVVSFPSHSFEVLRSHEFLSSTLSSTLAHSEHRHHSPCQT